ncbi:MAG: calcium/sodium antiporter [Bacteroidales bacterium]|nr:calcium/sodium antiporter [Bacteroidales bacterium]
MLDIIYLTGGIATIIISANWLVTGASAIAKKFGINDLVIGLTIVAFGTSAPELTVNIFSAISGSTDIAIGTVLGSNISNIFLIIGVAAVIYPIAIHNNTKWKEIPFSLLSVIILIFVANDVFIDKADENFISRIDGLVLLSFLIIFLIYTFGMAKKNKVEESNEEQLKAKPMWKAILLITIGLIGLFFGGKYLIEGAVNIADLLGMSKKVIGLTIIAIGTSLPELATSIVAAIKKKPDIIIGNVIGSNIFNVFFILGTTATIKPLPFDFSINFDVGVSMLASVLLFVTTMTLGRKIITRSEGIIFLVLYISFITYSIVK